MMNNMIHRRESKHEQKAERLETVAVTYEETVVNVTYCI